MHFALGIQPQACL